MTKIAETLARKGFQGFLSLLHNNSDNGQRKPGSSLLMNNTFKTDWARIDAMTDEDIDTSDIPPLGEAFFTKAKLRMPKSSVAVGHLEKYKSY